MISVGSQRKSGRSKRRHGRRKNRTSNSNVHSINPSLCLEARRTPIHHRDTIDAIQMNAKEEKGQVVVGQMNADMTRETGGEGRMAALGHKLKRVWSLAPCVLQFRALPVHIGGLKLTQEENVRTEWRGFVDS
jgi:hypothetical protein